MVGWVSHPVQRGQGEVKPRVAAAVTTTARSKNHQIAGHCASLKSKRDQAIDRPTHERPTGRVLLLLTSPFFPLQPLPGVCCTALRSQPLIFEFRAVKFLHMPHRIDLLRVPFHSVSGVLPLFLPLFLLPFFSLSSPFLLPNPSLFFSSTFCWHVPLFAAFRPVFLCLYQTSFPRSSSESPLSRTALANLHVSFLCPGHEVVVTARFYS